jgi:hypothetical protein
MSQEPWPYNGEDPWFSSKGRTMGVGKAVLCSHGPSRIVWSEKDDVTRPLYILLAEKEGRIWLNITCLRLYQFRRITWWCLFVLESILECVPKFVLKSVLLKKYWKKSWSHGICVRPTSWRWVRVRKTLGDHETLISIVRHVGLHVNFTSMKSTLGL